MLLPKRDFIFLRHGETDYNREGRFQGRIDVPLNRIGEAQAAAVVHTLKDHRISRIVASPAQRVLQTVRPLAEATGLPLQVESDLMEFYVGAFEGQQISAIRQAHNLGTGDSWLSILPDDADRWSEFVPRVCAAVARWTELHPDETILLASHGLVFRALTEALTGTQLATRNAEPQCFKAAGGHWAVTAVAPGS